MIQFHEMSKTYAADWLLQLWGVSSFYLVVSVFLWGVFSLFGKRMISLMMRVTLLMCALTLFSMGLGVLKILMPVTFAYEYFEGTVGILAFHALKDFSLPVTGVVSGIGIIGGVVLWILSWGCSLEQIQSIFRMLIWIMGMCFYGIKRLFVPSSMTAKQVKKTVVKQTKSYVKEEEGYSFPSIDLLNTPVDNKKLPGVAEEELSKSAQQLLDVLREFGINGKILSVKQGPVVTLYEFEPEVGIRSSRIISLSEDIARSMSAQSARVFVMQGKNAMGIEMPNKVRRTVYLKSILSSSEYSSSNAKLPLGLGCNIDGQSIVADLAKMPHLLVAGTTGSGKSVGVNAMILSLLYQCPPDVCKFIMVDPKMLELSVYDGIPHLLSPVVTDPKKAVVALKWVVQEMEARYRLMSQMGTKNIESHNKKIVEAKKANQVLSKQIQTGFDDAGNPIFEDKPFPMTLMPFIVVVVDEMADLMGVAGKEVEVAVQRLAQMARAAGIHLIMATQRPSVDVITGTIKANFPTRMAFNVTSKIDSRTILERQGAEKLLGMGDMLFMESGSRVNRLHGAFVAEEEVHRVVSFLKKANKKDHYVDISRVSEDYSKSKVDDWMNEDGESEHDELYNQAVSIVMEAGKVSTSFVQRRLNIGYNRAANLVEIMEKEGIVSSPNRTGRREIIKQE